MKCSLDQPQEPNLKHDSSSHHSRITEEDAMDYGNSAQAGSYGGGYPGSIPHPTQETPRGQLLDETIKSVCEALARVQSMHAKANQMADMVFGAQPNTVGGLSSGNGHDKLSPPRAHDLRAQLGDIALGARNARLADRAIRRTVGCPSLVVLAVLAVD